MNWYVRYRRDWIEQRLKTHGFINRVHITEKFDCSVQTATKDLTTFQENNSDWVQYNNRRKAYVKMEKTT